MRNIFAVVAALLFSATTIQAADKSELQQRRQRAAAIFHDGILLVHAKSALDLNADGFRQSAAFYYFTGLENTTNALLAIDGQSGQSWLFLASHHAFSDFAPPELMAGSDTAKRLGIDQVLDWSELEAFLARRAVSPARLYYASDSYTFEELPPSLTNEREPKAPLWVVAIQKKWPSFELKSGNADVSSLMAVQSQSEVVSVRLAAKATVQALMAGMRAIKPGVSQRSAEVAVVNACWQQGAHGTSFWPWAMTGENAVFPHPFLSLTRYDHLETRMKAGELVRLDVGCEQDHYQGDLGRTVPVSGHYTDEQRETWNVFVDAYKAGSKMLREGNTVDQVFTAWRDELVRHRESAKSGMTQRAIDTWSKRENIPFWQVHTMNLDAGPVQGPFRAGTTVAFEPIASIDGQGFYLEDMFLILKDGPELFTPGVPYTADEIEAAMR